MNKKDLIARVKKLREETGAGVMVCKRALEEAGGDFEKAKEIVRQQGLEKAEEKKERETRQGWVATYTHATGRIGVVVELLCETDFVARNPEFQRLAQELCLQVAAMKPKNRTALLKQEYIREPGKTIGELIKEAISRFGENIRVGKIKRVEIE